MQRRFENVAAVEVEINAEGWPHVVIFPNEGPPTTLVVRPQGHAEFIEHKADPNPLWSDKS